MKKLKMFHATWCPHCINSIKWIDELKSENEQYKNIHIELIDYEKSPEKMSGYSFYYVPTFYLDDEKIFEGAPTKSIIEEILQKSL